MKVVGIDEVGRGCWAGPLVAGAVLFDYNFVVSDTQSWKLSDSKVLSKTQRVAADAGIRKMALAVGLGWVSSVEVDELGLTKAVGLAMRRALEQINLSFDEVIVDGNYNFLSDDPRARAIIKADATVPAVSAASIIAKVARDTWMAERAALQFTAYGFEKHVGYGTALHREMLALHGACELHRRSYKPVRQILANSL